MHAALQAAQMMQKRVCIINGSSSSGAEIELADAIGAPSGKSWFKIILLPCFSAYINVLPNFLLTKGLQSACLTPQIHSIILHIDMYAQLMLLLHRHAEQKPAISRD